jgi:Predicted membrane protein
MNRMWRSLAVLLLTFGWLAGVPAVAQADGTDDRLTDYQVVATFDASGTAAVQLSLSVDFGDTAGHGPFLVFPLRQAIADDPDQWRMIDLTLGQVTSPSGADATVATEESDGNLVIRVGSEGRTFTGVQTYQVNYTVRGLIAPRQAQSGLDEINWNALGDGWELPVDRVAVTLVGPVDVTKTACFTGSGDQYTAACQSAHTTTAATFSAEGLGPNTGVQVVAGFPAGTFTGAEPRYTKRYWIGNMFPVTPFTGGVTALLGALGVALVARSSGRRNRDEVFVGLTPGVLPAPGQEVPVGLPTDQAPVAVAFTPPAGVRPGEAGTLVDSIADDRDITATIVDLAVRNQLQITQTAPKEWTFVRRFNPQDQLCDYEERFLDRLFSSGNRVSTQALRDESYATLMADVRKSLYDRVVELHWFRANPSHVRAGAIVGGVALIGLGVGLGFLAGLVGWGLLGLAVVLSGLAVLVRSNHFGRRTATGSAILAQTKGFELYLTTAEAEQIRFEEGIDVFSRYLPYAIVFGVAERWTKIFQQLADAGRYTFNPYWYAGYGYVPRLDQLGSSLSELGSTVSSSLQAATAATSGGSGFSGGGGFGGGGGGTW